MDSVGLLMKKVNELQSQLSKSERRNKILMEYVTSLSELKGDHPMINLRYTAEQILKSIGE